MNLITSATSSLLLKSLDKLFTLSVKFSLLIGATFVGFSATSSWMLLGSLLRKFLSDSNKAKTINYILGTLLALVAIDLVFHEELLNLIN